ncbi:uncharacterized protein BXIN_2344 [Babesia sp. Xinjiang]|uniref:uncharacterized protein n=1 Tax=Babesia sp. Xinjiang TaxID=462227 RepID=UPI000A21FAF9|nr:uncharacterized protein BXIN_2344 [Babesia sp. Xinjiang]ORM40698.1 hypothetical protein BXIN_2344 [Babesia sp. Xinjiang]
MTSRYRRVLRVITAKIRGYGKGTYPGHKMTRKTKETPKKLRFAKAVSSKEYYQDASAPTFQGPVEGEYEMEVSKEDGQPVLCDKKKNVVLKYVEPEPPKPSCRVKMINIPPPQRQRFAFLLYISVAFIIIIVLIVMAKVFP